MTCPPTCKGGFAKAPNSDADNLISLYLSVRVKTLSFVVASFQTAALMAA